MRLACVHGCAHASVRAIRVRTRVCAVCACVRESSESRRESDVISGPACDRTVPGFIRPLYTRWPG